MRGHKMRTFPIDQMTDPRGKGMVQIYEDRWWAVSEREELYFFGTDRSPWSSPQCNPNEELSRRINEDRRAVTDEKFKHCELTNYKETRQIPIVFVPVNINDYV